MSHKGTVSNPSARVLEQHDLSYDLITFDAKAKDAAEAAQKTGMPLPQTYKTLLLTGKKAGYVLVLCPGDKQVSLKKVGNLIGDKSMQMAKPNDVFSKTGCHIGGLGPLATRRTFPVLIEKSMLVYERIIINAGKRGHMLKVDPNDLVRVLDDVTFVDDLFES